MDYRGLWKVVMSTHSASLTAVFFINISVTNHSTVRKACALYHVWKGILQVKHQADLLSVVLVV